MIAGGRRRPPGALIGAIVLTLSATPLAGAAGQQTGDRSVQDRPAQAPDRAAPDRAVPDRPVPLRVFLDCRGCDNEFLRTTIRFVDWVRDPKQADVHVLITSARTGSGGERFEIALLERPARAELVEPLHYTTEPSDSDEMIRSGLARALTIGLLRYLAETPLAGQLDVEVTTRDDFQTAPVDDPWHGWVFSLRTTAAIEAEQSSRETEVGASVSADRITPEWKIGFGFELSQEGDRFEIDDEIVESTRRERDADVLIVRSLGEHWSIGGRVSIESSTFQNLKRAIELGPAVEFSVFPYAEFTRRELRFTYELLGQSVAYHERTIFDRTDERLARHELSAVFDRRDRWGSFQIETEISQYLHDLARYRFELGGDVSIRITRGLELTVETRYSSIRDQLFLPARDASPEEILLQRRQLASDFEYDLGVGFTYTFGSIFSNVVNPRFGE